jgi:2-methylisocitrate lyase-like PEP mutase family enzyme
MRGKSFSMAELAEAGVRRVSLATALYRASMTGLMAAAREVKEQGTFNFLDQTLTSSDISRYLLP